MFEVIRQEIYWLIKGPDDSLVHTITKTGWVGLKSNLPDYALSDKRMASHPLMFGYYDKAKAMKLCEKLNKEKESNKNKKGIEILEELHNMMLNEIATGVLNRTQEVEDFLKQKRESEGETYVARKK